MCEIQMQTLLGIFLAPDKYRFSILVNEPESVYGKYGLALHKGAEKVCEWRRFARDLDQVFSNLQNLLGLAIQCGEQGYFSSRRNYISEFCIRESATIPSRDEVLNEVKALFIAHGLVEPQRVRERELTRARERKLAEAT